ncbi:branched-chain amino acid ABC transporter permease [Azospirillum sp. TSO5]|uniref:branched-chain amino acid ABC transporter permease n=1 Tax=Azospirillum sp. TSO5 TaxID=716760 RepID=UPI000D652025|nr:branched-chain amino acid ABC transporter permease [Azospirillum sp. TSO5]
MTNDAKARMASALPMGGAPDGLPAPGAWLLPAGFLAVTVLLPWFLGDYGLRVATMVLMYLALAQAWNLVGGYAGLLSLAHPAFFGTGAIAMSVLLINGVSLLPAVAGAMTLSILIALLVSVPTLRLRGHYFVIATLLVAEGVRNLVLNMSAFGFRGGIAVNVINWIGLADLSARDYNLVFYGLMLVLAVAAMGLGIGLDRSRWGAALQAFRDDRAAAAALGVPSTKLLVTIFVVSAALTSLVGSVWAAWLGVVEANEAFGLKLTFQIVVMVFLGGKSTVWGPPIGVAIILLLDELIGVEFAEYTFIVSGLIVVTIVLFLPDGLIRLFSDGPKAMSWSALKANYSRYRVR